MASTFSIIISLWERFANHIRISIALGLVLTICMEKSVLKVILKVATLKYSLKEMTHWFFVPLALREYRKKKKKRLFFQLLL